MWLLLPLLALHGPLRWLLRRLLSCGLLALAAWRLEGALCLAPLSLMTRVSRRVLLILLHRQRQRLRAGSGC